jgi:short-subunit dehydrogenase
MSTDAYYRTQTVLLTADMARQLGAHGARVLLVARSADALDAVAAEVRAAGGEAEAIALDLQAPDAADRLVERVQGETIDVLINNAGYGIQGPFLDASEADTDGPVTLNVAALTGLTRRLLPGMVARGRGGVLHVASVAAFAPLPRFAVYAATKAYVRSFSDALHWELRGTGVHVSCLSPGPVRTGFAARAGMDDRFFSGALSSPVVARAGLDGLARNRRQGVPGLLNKAQVIATRLAPMPVTLAIAESLIRRAG